MTNANFVTLQADFVFQLLLESVSLGSTRRLNHLDENKVGSSHQTKALETTGFREREHIKR